MKKIISSVLAVSVIAASIAMPAMADYTAPENSYDVEQLRYTYDDDGSVTNDIDGTNAKQITSEERVIELEDNTLFANEYYMSFDFRYDTVDGAVPGKIQIDKAKSSLKEE